MGELRLMANGRIKALDKTEQETIIQYILHYVETFKYWGTEEAFNEV